MYVYSARWKDGCGEGGGLSTPITRPTRWHIYLFNETGVSQATNRVTINQLFFSIGKTFGFMLIKKVKTWIQ